MHPTRILVIGFTALIGTLSLLSCAQDYPSKPIRMVTMYTENANSVRERMLGVKLGEQLGTTIVFDAKAGGGGVIATRDVYRAQPVGYSLLLASNNFVANTSAYKEPGYRIDDYTPVGVMGQTPYALVINSALLPVTNLAQFVAWVKANPGKINYGSLGPASGSNISAERFKQMTGISMTGVPYKGGDQMALAMLAGDIHVSWLTLNSARTRMQNKQIIGIATAGEDRSSLMPDLPTFKELGYPEMDTSTWYALFAPAAIPAAMLTKLRSAYAKLSEASDWKALMQLNQMDPFKGTLDQFMAGVRKEAVKLGEDYRRLNLPQE